jgi:uncharacterized membrane protein YphA (DoxX/SURF4 family)
MNLLRLRPEHPPRWPLALARMLMGLLWLGSLRWKLPPDFESSNETSLREWLELEVEHPFLGPYGRFIESVVLPNFTLFAWLVFLAELAVGLSLLVGAWTEIAAFVGLLMSVNLSIGLLEVPGEWPWSYLMMAMWHGALLVSGAGMLWGIDGWRKDRAVVPVSKPSTTEPPGSKGMP